MLGAFLLTAAAAMPVQLPPEIELDRRLLAAREAMQRDAHVQPGGRREARG